MKHASAAVVILPSLSFVILLLLALVHLYSEFRQDIAWGSLNPDLSTNEGIERTKVLRTCHADDWSRNKGPRVVMVTTLSHEKIKEFNGVDNFYDKIWRNRKAFADLHGPDSLSCPLRCRFYYHSSLHLCNLLLLLTLAHAFQMLLILL